MEESFNVVPAHLVVKAMQDSGYKNAAYAIAELIDNSIQAGASRVELLCLEKKSIVLERSRSRIAEIAVLDNGSGMSASELRRALQFGNGGHLDDRDGIGRFGMGLPNSSMSQGSRVDVWTWTDGPGSAVYSYLDLHEIARREQREVPEPKACTIPTSWVERSEEIADSGTLVLWSRPDRCTWKSSKAIVRNAELLVGRMYRRFLADRRVEIRMAAFNDSRQEPTLDERAKPNDPMYLIADTSCPSPFSSEPMFEPYGDKPQQRITVDFAGARHEIVVSYSVAKKEARSGHAPGKKLHGKHAKKNSGVSIMRADRELELDSKWLPVSDPVVRWIGIEVDFPPALDEVFGVSNNKQAASHLSDMAGYDKEEFASREGYDTFQELQTSWAEDHELRYPLLAVRNTIESNIRSMMRVLTAQTRGKRGKKRHLRESAEYKATEATENRKKEGHEGASDAQESEPAEYRLAEVVQGLVDDGVQPDSAKELGVITVDLGLKYVFGHAPSTSGAFFSVKPKGGALLITLNTSHPAYKNLVAVLEDSGPEVDEGTMRVLLERARDGLKLLLTAWARYEDEEPAGSRRTAVQDSREDWGRVARQFLQGG